MSRSSIFSRKTSSDDSLEEKSTVYHNRLRGKFEIFAGADGESFAKEKLMAVVKNDKFLQENDMTAEDAETTFEELFEKYDDSPKDGKITFNEFQKAWAELKEFEFD
eukprot:CAMPEP_0115864592 /NCGR_PEP_ID=MMETSP0287-20121206/19280_1 /TAXON_ID=412157 /ORGANISM="Chrysochromulina rotalis, Strain UIO044" /LENGTH=106 /DNA_ID=CAMNT_0003319067 /DNA_START=63 /DNA_END=383 /DNA_ORIENTATION=-